MKKLRAEMNATAAAPAKMRIATTWMDRSTSGIGRTDGDVLGDGSHTRIGAFWGSHSATVASMGISIACAPAAEITRFDHRAATPTAAMPRSSPRKIDPRVAKTRRAGSAEHVELAVAKLTTRISRRSG